MMIRIVTSSVDSRRTSIDVSLSNLRFTFQAWIRGVLARNRLRLLHLNAITIQRHWRGYRARIFTDRYLTERVHQTWQDHYDRMATKIQATWRGHRHRKTNLDLPRMKRWLENVYAKNNETVEEMKQYRRNQIEYTERVVEHESMQWVLFILFKLHHLLRTAQRPGVITRIDERDFTFIEEMLKCFEFRRYTAGRKINRCRECRIDPKPSLVFRGTHYEKCEREIREFERNLRAGGVPIFRSTWFSARVSLREQIANIVLAYHAPTERYCSSSDC
ncbi:uncharacterized protein LOC143150079 [Ptiloglossa arizonensis]|uniref:uncharacterized protein LOC143150079 n=1 Tax=Ptiloglossa arizonensis TaxID=3350558 RepID=UPI003FA06636